MNQSDIESSIELKKELNIKRTTAEMLAESILHYEIDMPISFLKQELKKPDSYNG